MAPDVAAAISKAKEWQERMDRSERGLERGPLTLAEANLNLLGPVAVTLAAALKEAGHTKNGNWCNIAPYCGGCFALDAFARAVNDA